MFVSHVFTQSRYLLTTLIGICFSQGVLADAAGRVNFVLGEATAINSENKSRLLYKGDLVNSGERIETNAKGRIQIRMTDGGFLSLRPNSVFLIEKYNFSRDTPNQGALVFNFLKGSMRTLSGAIGKVNRANYRFTTPTATIGIRGTDYAGTLNNDVLTVTVNEGQINLANPLGSVDVSAGQTYEARAGQAPTPSSATVEQDNFETEEEESSPDNKRPTTAKPLSAAAAAVVVAGTAAATDVVEPPRPRLENYANYNLFLQAMYAYKKFEEEKNSPKVAVNGTPGGQNSPELSEYQLAGGTGDVSEGAEALGAKTEGTNDTQQNASDRFTQAWNRSSFTNFPLRAVDSPDLRQSSIDDSLNSGFNADATLIDDDHIFKVSVSTNDYNVTNQQFQNLSKLYREFFLRLAGSKLFGNTLQLYMDPDQFNDSEITVIQRFER